MSDLFWLSEAQLSKMVSFSPLSHCVAHVDDRRVISGIIFILRNGLRWCDAPFEYGPQPCTAGLSAGAVLAFLIVSSPAWLATPAIRTP